MKFIEKFDLTAYQNLIKEIKHYVSDKLTHPELAQFIELNEEEESWQTVLLDQAQFDGLICVYHPKLKQYKYFYRHSQIIELPDTFEGEIELYDNLAKTYAIPVIDYVSLASMLQQFQIENTFKENAKIFRDAFLSFLKKLCLAKKTSFEKTHANVQMIPEMSFIAEMLWDYDANKIEVLLKRWNSKTYNYNLHELGMLYRLYQAGDSLPVSLYKDNDLSKTVALLIKHIKKAKKIIIKLDAKINDDLKVKPFMLAFEKPQRKNKFTNKENSLNASIGKLVGYPHVGVYRAETTKEKQVNDIKTEDVFELDCKIKNLSLGRYIRDNIYKVDLSKLINDNLCTKLIEKGLSKKELKRIINKEYQKLINNDFPVNTHDKYGQSNIIAHDISSYHARELLNLGMNQLAEQMRIRKFFTTAKDYRDERIRNQFFNCQTSNHAKQENKSLFTFYDERELVRVCQLNIEIKDKQADLFVTLSLYLKKQNISDKRVLFKINDEHYYFDKEFQIALHINAKNIDQKEGNLVVSLLSTRSHSTWIPYNAHLANDIQSFFTNESYADQFEKMPINATHVAIAFISLDKNEYDYDQDTMERKYREILKNRICIFKQNDMLFYHIPNQKLFIKLDDYTCPNINNIFTNNRDNKITVTHTGMLHEDVFAEIKRIAPVQNTMFCSEYAGRMLIANMAQLNQNVMSKLCRNEKYNDVLKNNTERLIQSPFPSNDDLQALTPKRLMDVLKHNHSIKRVKKPLSFLKFMNKNSREKEIAKRISNIEHKINESHYKKYLDTTRAKRCTNLIKKISYSDLSNFKRNKENFTKQIEDNQLNKLKKHLHAQIALTKQLAWRHSDFKLKLQENDDFHNDFVLQVAINPDKKSINCNVSDKVMTIPFSDIADDFKIENVQQYAPQIFYLLRQHKDSSSLPIQFQTLNNAIAHMDRYIKKLTHQIARVELVTGKLINHNTFEEHFVLFGKHKNESCLKHQKYIEESFPVLASRYKNNQRGLYDLLCQYQFSQKKRKKLFASCALNLPNEEHYHHIDLDNIEHNTAFNITNSTGIKEIQNILKFYKRDKEKGDVDCYKYKAMINSIVSIRLHSFFSKFNRHRDVANFYSNINTMKK